MGTYREGAAVSIPGTRSSPRPQAQQSHQSVHEKLASYRAQYGRLHDGRPVGAQLQEETPDHQSATYSRVAPANVGRQSVPTNTRNASPETNRPLASSFAAVGNRGVSGRR